MAHLVCVKILMLAQIDFFPFLRSLEKKLSFRLLRHDIFADERSLASMDLKARTRIFDGERIMELRQESGAVFLVAHNLSEVEETCNRVIWLERGEIIMDGDDVPGIIDAYLEASGGDRRTRQPV